MATERRPSAKVKPGTKATSRVQATGRATRVSASPAPRSGVNPLLIGGIAGGAILVIVIAVVAFGNSNRKKEETRTSSASKTPAGPKVDSKLHQSGVAKCEKGLSLVEAAEPRIARRRSMNKTELDQLKKELQDAQKMLLEGMGEIERSGAKETVNRYQNAIAACRSYLKELSGE